jgi:hypothetical protein
MHKGFKSLSEIIKTDPGLKRVRKIINQSEIVNAFAKIFPELKKIAKAVKVEKDTLFLRVENPAWRNELKFQEKKIAEKINNHFNEEHIKRLKFIS